MRPPTKNETPPMEQAIFEEKPPLTVQFFERLADGLEGKVGGEPLRVTWTPNSGPQELAYYCEADELFYGGGAGGGKTDLIIGLALFMHHKALIVRREAEQVKGIIERFEELGCDRFLNKSSRTYFLGGGHTIRLGGVKDPGDEQKYQGRARDLTALDELPHFSEKQYLFLSAWTRTTIPGQRTRVVATGNPPTDEEGGWIIRRWGPWLDPKHPKRAKPGELRWYVSIDGVDTEVTPRFEVLLQDGTVIPLEDVEEVEYHLERLPRATIGGEVLVARPALMILPNGEEALPRSRTFIPALMTDNPYLDRSYQGVIDSLPEPLRSQLKHGDFGVGRSDNPWQVFPTAWVDAAMERWEERTPEERGPLTALGVDIARGGKGLTVIAKRYGAWFDRIKSLPGVDTSDGPTAAAVIVSEHEYPADILVDVVGVGSSPYDSLKSWAEGMPGVNVIGFNGATPTKITDKTGKLRMRNIRAAAHWKLMESLDPVNGDGIALPPDPELRADLLAVRWKLTPAGVQLWDKGELTEKTGRGFHHSDAVVNAAFMESPPVDSSEDDYYAFWGNR